MQNAEWKQNNNSMPIIMLLMVIMLTDIHNAARIESTKSSFILDIE